MIDIAKEGASKLLTFAFDKDEILKKHLRTSVSID
jgi:hypothetical protein